jgi:hypothetical protein
MTGNLNRGLLILSLILLTTTACGDPLNFAPCADQPPGWCGPGQYCEQGPNGSSCVHDQDADVTPGSGGGDATAGAIVGRDGGGATGGNAAGGHGGGTSDDAGPAFGFGGAVDAASSADGPLDLSVVDSERVDLGTPDVAVCSEGTTRSCAMDGALGNCAAGSETCKDAKWGRCSVLAQTGDHCDVPGDDSSCNGKPNEGCPCVTGDKLPCGPSMETGICKRGSQSCTNGQWGTCQGAIYPRTRDCTSSLDNDCDGRPDSTLDAVCQCGPVNGSRACDTHPQDGMGSCHAGMQTCLAGANNTSTAWGGCSGSVGPAALDTCVLGNDANCNGIPNESCRSLGQGCGSGTECVSGNCVQGICCDSACVGKCSSCQAASTGQSPGKCAPVTMGLAHGNDCVASSSSCGTNGRCDGSGGCQFWGSDHVCASPTCSMAAAVPAGMCNGQGSCVVSQSAPCPGNFVCGGDICKTSCGSDLDCVSTHHCAASVCVTRCLSASPNNAVSNPGFDMNVWSDFSGSGGWDAKDVSDCSRSGSMRVEVGGDVFSDCFSVSAKTSYFYGFDVDSLGSGGGCNIDWFANLAACQAGGYFDDTTLLSFVPGWAHRSTVVTSSNDAAFAKFYCSDFPARTYLDRFYLNHLENHY